MDRSQHSPDKNYAPIDPLLQPYLIETDHNQSESLLELLLHQHADPVIRKSIHRKLFAFSASAGTEHPERNVEDLCSEARLSLLRTLRRMKTQPGIKGIHNFYSYVSAIARQVCDQQLRRVNPNRWRIKNQIRYACSHYKDFAIWETTEGFLVAGNRIWKGKNFQSNNPNVEEFSIKVSRQIDSGLKGTKKLISFLQNVFDEIEGPIELEDLVAIAESALGIPAIRYESLSGTSQQDLPETAKGVDEKLQYQKYFERLWIEICLLPQLQRVAILLGLKDATGRPLLPSFLLLNITTIENIAAQFPFTRKEFAEIWNDLPLTDREIAQKINLTSQKIANLRKCARERLTRRLLKSGMKR